MQHNKHNIWSNYSFRWNDQLVATPRQFWFLTLLHRPLCMGLNFLNRFVVSVSFLGRPMTWRNLRFGQSCHGVWCGVPTCWVLLLNRQVWRCDRPFLFRAGSAVFCVITSGEILAWLTRCFLNCHLVVHFIPLLNWRLKWLALGRVDQHVFIRLQLRSVNSENSVYDHWFFDTKGIRHCTRSVMAVVSSWLGCGLPNSSKRSNYSDLTRPHPKRWFSKGNPLISAIPRLVKYYRLAG